MSKKHNKTLIITISILVLGILFLIAGYFLVKTQNGSKWVTQRVINHFLEPETQMLEEFDGNLVEGVLLKNIELVDIQGLPAGTKIRIQSLSAELTSFGLNGLIMEIINGRLIIPGADPIIIQGTLEQGKIDINVFSSSLDVNHVINLFDLNFIKDASIKLNEVDLYVSGTLSRAVLKGDLTIKDLVYNDIRLTDAPLKVNIDLEKKLGQYKPHGNINATSGRVLAKKTKLTLQSSRIGFKGSFDNPELNIRAQTKVHNTEIFVVITGTKDKPDVQLSSNPPLSEDKLLIMLVTGANWKTIESSYSEQRITPELAKELMDYYVFRGRGKSLGKRLGIKDVKLIYDEDKKGFGFTKEVSNSVDVQYQRQQISDTTGQITEQKIGGELKVNKNVSFTLDREFSDATEGDEVSENQQIDDKFMIKYKKSF